MHVRQTALVTGYHLMSHALNMPVHFTSLPPSVCIKCRVLLFTHVSFYDYVEVFKQYQHYRYLKLLGHSTDLIAKAYQKFDFQDVELSRITSAIGKIKLEPLDELDSRSKKQGIIHDFFTIIGAARVDSWVFNQLWFSMEHHECQRFAS